MKKDKEHPPHIFRPTKTTDIHSGEDFYQYPSIPYLEEFGEILDADVEVYEKVDGSNFQFRVKEDGRVLTGTRTRYIGRHNRHQYNFGDFDSYIRRMLRDKSHLVDKRYVFYCEYLSEMGHTLSYPRAYRGRAVLIDIFDTNSGKFLAYETAGKVAEDLDLDLILLPKLNKKPKIAEGDLSGLLKGSQFGAEKKEGLVLKNYGLERAAKYVDPEFRKIRDSLSLEESSMIDRAVEKCVRGLNGILKKAPGRPTSSIVNEVFSLLEKDLAIKRLLRDKRSSEASKMRIEQAIKVKVKDLMEGIAK